MSPVSHTNLEPVITAEQIRARVAEIGGKISRDYPDEAGAAPLRMIGVLKGAVVFLSDLARAIPREVSIDFLGAGSYGASTVSSGEVRITKDLDEPIKGLDVVLVEDIIDTGLTVARLRDHLRGRDPKSLRIATLLDKPSRRVVPLTPDYLGFEIPDQFVVGYGLDFGQRYRNLPDICALRNPEQA